MLDQYTCHKNKGNANHYIDKHGVVIELYGLEWLMKSDANGRNNLTLKHDEWT